MGLLKNVKINELRDLPVQANTFVKVGFLPIKDDGYPSGLYGFDVCRQYEMTVTISKRYRASDSAIGKATEHAKRQLAMFIYEDVLHGIDEAVSSVFAGDAEETLRNLRKLKEQIVRSIEHIEQ